MTEKEPTATITVLEKNRRRGVYDLRYREAILEHPELGRIWIVEGYGGETTLHGGAYRWRHGIVARIDADDTLATIDHAAIHQMDLLELDGASIEQLALDAGLAAY